MTNEDSKNFLIFKKKYDKLLKALFKITQG